MCLLRREGARNITAFLFGATEFALAKEALNTWGPDHRTVAVAGALLKQPAHEPGVHSLPGDHVLLVGP